MQRLHSIDYLRGLMALAVLIYHFMSWTVGVPDASTILGRLGIYAVSTFYIVSGMSLFIAYQNSVWGTQNIFIFFVKRYLRLAPAFWVACTMAILLLAVISPTYVISPEKLIANFTLTFGFYAPSKYITTGGWSIGNEMVFYALFPLAMMMPRIRSSLMAISLTVGAGCYFYFAFFGLEYGRPLADQWSVYIHPLNQAFLFFVGVSTAWATIKYQLIGNKLAPAILAASAIAFCIHPASGDTINIVYGWTRLVFTAICAACCFAVLTIKFRLPPALDKILFAAGYLSYSLYMFHGVFADFTLHFIAPVLGISTPITKLALLLCITLPCLTLFTFAFFKFVESPVMSLGKFLSSDPRAPSASKGARYTKAGHS
ncbi:acyltransferase [Stutzerimonas nitrititolerans]|uniref:acyltransferase family protein n=1 Tax=Stutzerimonas nitrititolerans TaxID=2482751 RepID=UPI0028A787AB|nr:acyltransferase [Stutzerimonas nitrititolerans]